MGKGSSLHCWPQGSLLQDWRLEWPAWPWALDEVDGEAIGERCLESDTTDHISPKFDIDMLVSLLRQENV